MSSELLTSRTGCTLILTLSGPATRNTLSSQVSAAGIEALNMAESDPSVRAVIVRGDGAHFCAGADFHELARLRPNGAEGQADAIARFHDWIESLRTFPKPTLAAVEGIAAGDGMALALACDLVVAASDAQFMMAHARQVGLTPTGGASWHLARLVPRSLALELLWLTTPNAVERLYACGCVNHIAAPGRALADASAIADRLAAMAPNTVMGTKELLARASLTSLHEHLEKERQQFMAHLFHPNGGEGLKAFFEKRLPIFR